MKGQSPNAVPINCKPIQVTVSSCSEAKGTSWWCRSSTQPNVCKRLTRVPSLHGLQATREFAMTEAAVVQPQTLDAQSPSAAAQALQSLQDRPSETTPPEAIKPSSKTLIEVEGVTYKRCTHCKEQKIRDQNFNKDKSRGDGFACTCKGCANRHTRAWHEKHKQQVKHICFTT